MYVPEDLVEDYKAHEVWGQFFIQPIKEAPTAIENTNAGQVDSRKHLRDGQVLILRGDKLYTIDGRLVR